MVSMLARLLAALRRLLRGREEVWVHPSNAITRYVLGEQLAIPRTADEPPASAEQPAEEPREDSAASAA